MSARARMLEADLEGIREPVRTRVMLFRVLLSLGGRLRMLMDRQLEPTGITTQQAACLMIVGASETALAQGEIARVLGVSHQNVRQLLDALERKGLVTIDVDPEDRRAKRIRASKAARRIFERRNAEDYEVVAGWFGGLDDRDAGELLRLSRAVAEGLPDRARG